MPTIGIEGTGFVVDRLAVKQALIARLERLLEVEKANFDETRREKKNRYDQARQPNVLDALSEGLGVVRSLDDIDDRIVELEEARTKALKLKEEPSSQIVQHGSIVELAFDNETSTELFLIFGEKGVDDSDILLGGRTLVPISKSCDLTLSLLDNKPGQRFSYKTNGDQAVEGKIIQVF